MLTLFVEELKTQSSNGLGLFVASATPTQALGQLTQTVADALELANQNVNQQLVRSVSRFSYNLVGNNTTALEALDLERLQKIVKFKVGRNRQIVVLTEQI